MLYRLGSEYDRQTEYNITEDKAVLPITEASVGKTFPWKLEYNCPVHETWNIVHIGMLIPEAHQIYVCSDNCVRGVIMTADEMGAGSRFSSVMPNENDVVSGRLTQVSIDGACDVISRLDYRPRAVLVFLVCMHLITGADRRYIYDEIRRRNPDIDVMECLMYPIAEKLTRNSIEVEWKAMLSPMIKLKDEPADYSTISIFGDDLKMQYSDLYELSARYGKRILQVQDCHSYDEYLAMSRSFLYITRSAFGVYGLKSLTKENGHEYMYLPPAVTYEEIEQEELQFVEAIADNDEDLAPEDNEKKISQELKEYFSQQTALCEEKFKETFSVTGDREIRICSTGHPRFIGLARILLEHGFNVTRVYSDSISPEEKDDLAAVQHDFPQLKIQSISEVKSRILNGAYEGKEDEILAIGPKAGYFSQTRYFVNIIEADGSFGFTGLRHILDMMIEASDHPNDKYVVTRKGLGNPSLWQEP